MSKKPFIVLSILASLALAGCSEKGPAEKAGEQVDKAVEQTKDAIQDAGHQGPAERTGEAIDQKVDEIKDQVEEMKDNPDTE
jgi:outer membrane biogenesis lipoprotein LolB